MKIDLKHFAVIYFFPGWTQRRHLGRIQQSLRENMMILLGLSSVSPVTRRNDVGFMGHEAQVQLGFHLSNVAWRACRGGRAALGSNNSKPAAFLTWKSWYRFCRGISCLWGTGATFCTPCCWYFICGSQTAKHNILTETSSQVTEGQGGKWGCVCASISTPWLAKTCWTNGWFRILPQTNHN